MAPGERSRSPRPKLSQESNQASRVFAISSSDLSCQVCLRKHRVGSCDEFRRMPAVQRRALAGRWKLCYNSLGFAHNAQQCDSTNLCRECSRRHHSLLHPDALSKRTTTDASRDEPPSKRLHTVTNQAQVSAQGPAADWVHD